MSRIYITIEGDVLDAICFRHYGFTDGGVMEAVLEANPHITGLGAELRAGIEITLIDYDRPVATLIDILS